eukprot:64039_1
MIFNDQKLDKTEIECLENYFDEKYDLKIHQPENASCDDLSVLQSCVPDGSVAAWYDGDSYDDINNIWRDKTCNGQDATIKGVLNYFDGCSEVMIFNDQKLDKTEIECLENYFDEKYDLKIHQPENASCDDLSVLQS